MMYEPWRRLTTGDRDVIMQNILGKMVEKYQAGRKEHGDTFQGDPVQHGMDEAVDTAFYMELIRRKIEYLEERLGYADEFIRCDHSGGFALYCRCGGELPHADAACRDCGVTGEEIVDRGCLLCGVTLFYDGSVDW